MKTYGRLNKFDSFTLKTKEFNRIKHVRIKEIKDVILALLKADTIGNIVSN